MPTKEMQAIIVRDEMGAIVVLPECGWIFLRYSEICEIACE